MKSLEIVTASDKDIQDLIRLFSESEEFHRKNRPDILSQPPLEDLRAMFLKFLTDSKVRTLLAKQDGIAIGFARYRKLEISKSNFFVKSGQTQAIIEELVVSSAFRRKGIAKNLMMHIESELRQQGISHIQLNVFSFNEPAQELYQSLGYQPMFLRLSKDLE